jgi:hypothetical protein
MVAVLIVFTSLVAVGITAPVEAPFTISIRPVFANLGVDVDIKVWTVHLHFGWSAMQSGSSTKAGGTLL